MIPPFPPSDDLLDAYAAGDAAAMLDEEYRLLVQAAQRFTERAARVRVAPALPTALELVAALAAESFPAGPPPSLSDALHALDRLFATWQGEEPPFQRLQARRLSQTLAQLTLLWHALDIP